MITMFGGFAWFGPMEAPGEVAGKPAAADAAPIEKKTISRLRILKTKPPESEKHECANTMQHERRFAFG